MVADDLQAAAKRTSERLEIRLRRGVQEGKRLGNYLAPFVANVGASTATFNLGLLVAQGAGYAVGLSCATPVLAPAVGLLGVSASAAAAGQVSLRVERMIRPESFKTKTDKVFWEHLLIDALIGAVFYKALGGRFRNILPSNLAMPGAFASQSIFAKDASYCTPAQKNELIRAFRRDGCHTCGVRGGRRVIGDHQPPNKVVYGSSEAAQASRVSSKDLSGSFTNAASKAATSLATGRGYSEAAEPIMKAVKYAMKVIPAEMK
eukprot:CAMPEP_0177765350 /NCGR_PEP_ID=MMETSP0491_2-20121128/7947_1 /TAXON_ID=63592 /ORGANISM="Tetraselmis chuii, Strain PLY429" /LENGTH=261 /DNA_ID=CAMNT_0019281697 /DNA_START=41 /DNA_END=823 /DNA_ORIENTATION=+